MNESYIDLVVREFRRLQKLADGAISQMAPDDFFASPHTSDNSAAVIVKHVAGNMVSRWTDFLTSDGEKPSRDRDSEFEIRSSDTREHLIESWNEGWRSLFGALSALRSEDLDRVVIIRGESLSVLQAINRQLTHYAYHVGQIVYVAKHYCGDEWKRLSIPLGRSKDFNQEPVKYIEEAQPGATDNLGYAQRVREGSSFRSSEARCLSFIVRPIHERRMVRRRILRVSRKPR